MKTFLHVGCGLQNQGNIRSPGLQTDDWQEIRYDINAGVGPDILGTLTDLSSIGTATMDALYSSHNIEHLYSYQVPVALAEFRRVLKPDGFALIACPDLQAAAQAVVDGLIDVKIYESARGTIALTPMDILFGWDQDLRQGNDFMAHKTGFTQSLLKDRLEQAGFATVLCLRGALELWAVATTTAVDWESLKALAMTYLPMED